MANKVKYGLKSVYYAVATIDAATNSATYGTPKAWPGAVNLSLDAEGNTTKFRADNIDYWVGQSNNGYSGDFDQDMVQSLHNLPRLCRTHDRRTRRQEAYPGIHHRGYGRTQAW